MKRQRVNDLDAEVRRLRMDPRQLSSENAWRAREIAAAWLEYDVREMCRRGDLANERTEAAR